MSLNFDFTKIADAKSLDHPNDPDAMNPVADCMVWAMLAIQMESISDKTIDVVKRRLRQYQLVTGPLMGEFYLTDDDVDRYKGLVTNVTTRAESSFRAMLMQHIDRQQMSQTRSGWDLAQDWCKRQAQGSDAA